jgi:hypothetical protein
MALAHVDALPAAAAFPTLLRSAAGLTGEPSITGPQQERLVERHDEYTAKRVFWVPPEARLQNLQHQATRADFASLIDNGILAVERDNEGLKSKRPRDYARRGKGPMELKGLIDLIANIGFKAGRDRARAILGGVYEHFRGNSPRPKSSMAANSSRPAASCACWWKCSNRSTAASTTLLGLRRHVHPVRKIRRSPPAGCAPTSESLAKN